MKPQRVVKTIRTGIMRALVGMVALVVTAASGLSEVRLVIGDGEKTPLCSAILAPTDHRTPDGSRPLRLRIVTDTGRGLRLALLANDDPSRIEIVTGDLRRVFDPARIDSVAAMADHPVWTALLASSRFHLTEQRDDTAVRTARFEAPELAGLLDRMAQDCGLVLPRPGAPGVTPETIEADLGLTGDAVRLVNLAVHTALGEARDPTRVADTLYGAGRDRLETALRRMGAPPRRYLDDDTLARVIGTFGLVIAPAYRELGDVAGDRVAVRATDGWQIIDTQGRAVTGEVFRAAAPGVAAALPMQVGGGWVLFGPDGQRLRNGRSDSPPACTASGCVLQRGSRIRFVALDSGVVSAMPFDEVRQVTHGWAAVRVGNRWGFATADGAAGGPMVAARDLSDAVDGRAVLTLTTGRQRIVAVPGMNMIGPERDDIRPSPGGLFAFRAGAVWGLVTPKTGDVHVDPVWRAIGHFARGLAPATSDGTTWGYVDRSGAWRIAPRFRSAGPFGNGFARVETARGRHGFVDASGQLVVAAIFDAARDMAGGFAAVRFGEHWGLVSAAALQRRK